ncbi:MAG: hypothetical protein ACYCZR_07145 [Burkholderiales bacterium]
MTIQPTGTTSFIQILTYQACRPESATATTGVNGNTTANSAAKVTISAAARQLAAPDVSYDFTNMTPHQMKSVAQNLCKAGKIDPVQLFELENAGMPLGRMGRHGELVPLSTDEKARYANMPVNYVQTIQNVIQFMETSGEVAYPKSTTKEWQGLLSLMQEMQGQPSTRDLSQYRGVAIPVPAAPFS